MNPFYDPGWHLILCISSDRALQKPEMKSGFVSSIECPYLLPFPQCSQDLGSPRLGFSYFSPAAWYFPELARVEESVIVVERDPSIPGGGSVWAWFAISMLMWWGLSFQRCVIPWEVFINHFSKTTRDCRAIWVADGPIWAPTVAITGLWQGKLWPESSIAGPWNGDGLSAATLCEACCPARLASSEEFLQELLYPFSPGAISFLWHMLFMSSHVGWSS